MFTPLAFLLLKADFRFFFLLALKYLLFLSLEAFFLLLFLGPFSIDTGFWITAAFPLAPFSNFKLLHHLFEWFPLQRACQWHSVDNREIVCVVVAGHAFFDCATLSMLNIFHLSMTTHWSQHRLLGSEFVEMLYACFWTVCMYVCRSSQGVSKEVIFFVFKPEAWLFLLITIYGNSYIKKLSLVFGANIFSRPNNPPLHNPQSHSPSLPLSSILCYQWWVQANSFYSQQWS